MNYALVEASGKQFWITPGRYYDFNYIGLRPGDRVNLLRVLLINDEGNVTVGKPCIEDAFVEATVLGHLRDRKVTIYKMRPKKKTRKKRGYRNDLTRIMINSIHVKGLTLL